MLDAVVHVEVGEVDGVRLVVAREQLGHVAGDEDAEGGREVVCVANSGDELAVGNVPPIARYDAYDRQDEIISDLSLFFF